MRTAICTITGKEFVISDLEEAYCEERQIPLPTIAPLERLRQVSAFLSSIHLYSTQCAYTGKEILTFIPPESRIKVYDIDTWMSDDWDQCATGKDYDFSRPFFEQMRELQMKAPFPSLECVRSTMENSDFTNGVLNVKNCYLSFGVLDSEDVLFSRTVLSSKDIIDCIYVTNSEVCSGCIQIKGCYNLKYSQDCTNCRDSAFLYDCHNCKNCFQSSNLVNQEYYFQNKPCTKDEYLSKMAAIDLGSAQVIKEQKAAFTEMKSHAFVRCMQGQHNENCNGNYIDHSKNCFNSIFCNDAENVEWSIQMVHASKDSFVIDGFGQNGQFLYNSSAVGENAYELKFCYDCYGNVRNLEYCIFVGISCTDCFGCIGLHHKQYCILNKQYSKEEYEVLLARIKEHMKKTGEYGQFFPNDMSIMYYNQSEGHVFMPLSKEEALQRGFRWKEYQPENFTQNYRVPDNIADVEDSILNATLKCKVTGKKFKIIKQELAAYRKLHIPIPDTAPLARLDSIINSLTISELTPQNCINCQQEMLTMYDTTTQKVLCEKCYQEKVR